MSYEKIIINENGDKIKIHVNFIYQHCRRDNKICRYDILLSICKKGKRKFIYINYEDDYNYRILDIDKRDDYKHNLYLNYVTEYQILSAKNEFWQLLSPINN